jgi:hypothetical protein
MMSSKVKSSIFNCLTFFFLFYFSSRICRTKMENFCCQHVDRYIFHNCIVRLAMDCLLFGRLENICTCHICTTCPSHFHTTLCSRISKVRDNATTYAVQSVLTFISHFFFQGGSFPKANTIRPLPY